MCHSVRVVLLAMLGLTSAVALGSEDPFAWSEPSAIEQLHQEKTIIPVGKGALLVPSITGPLNEPPVILVDESGEEVTDIPTGRRVLLDPGSYTVIVSTGTPGQGIGTAVEVEEGQTTLVPVKWGALRVEVVDSRRLPHRGGYEIIRADTREPYGTGFGADTLQGENLNTWLLPPGLYRIVRPGANYRALRDFATVYVPESGFVRYRLVTDPNTGEFQGSGVLLPGEFGSPVKAAQQRWSKNLVLGLIGSAVSQQNVVGVNNQMNLSGSLFLDGQASYKNDHHLFSALVQVEEGVGQIRPREAQPLPVVKSRDRLRTDLLYTYFLNSAVGPYARVAAETQGFETNVLVTEDTTFLRRELDGSEREEYVAANETLKVANAWQPTILREGIGMNTRFVNNRWVTLNWRAGFGLRQNRYAGAYLLDDDLGTPGLLEYTAVPSFDQEGIESTLIATARLPGWAVYATNLELFAAFDSLSEPSIEWRNTLTFRLTRNLSINYYANVAYLPQVIGDLQVDQSVLLRASWVLL